MLRIAALTLSLTALAACTGTDGQRAAAGAFTGATAALVLDRDPVTGAALGAAAGALCDDAGVCEDR